MVTEPLYLNKNNTFCVYDNMPIAYSFCKVIFDHNNNPVDYIFLEINNTFEKILGLKSEDILGKKATQLQPDICNLENDSIYLYGKVAITGESLRFDHFAAGLKRWFSITIFTDMPGYVTRIAHDITESKNEYEAYKLLNKSLINFLQSPYANINYQLAADDLLQLTNAKFVVVNIFERENEKVIVKAISGKKREIEEGFDIIGVDLIGKSWYLSNFSPHFLRSEKLSIITDFSDINSKYITDETSERLTKRLKIGNIYGIGIKYSDEVLGSLLIIMPQSKQLICSQLVELFTNQLAIAILRQRLEFLLQKNEELLEFAFEGSGDVIWDLSLCPYEISFFNRNTENFRKPDLHKKIKYVEYMNQIHPDDFEMHQSIIQQYICGKITNHNIAFRLKDTAGNYNWILSRGKLVDCTLDGKPLRVVGTHKDITKQKEFEETLKKAKDAAEKANQSKNEFIANVSHELRTPLNVILSALQLINLKLDNGILLNSDSSKKHMRSIKQNCFRLVRMVNNLIDSTKFEAGFLELNLHNYDIVKILKGITLSVRDFVEQRNLSLKFISNIKSKIIACDNDMMERIILNLLSNSIKFNNPNGSIIVTLTDNKTSILISIKDTGIGIPEDKTQIIFERFKQLNYSLAKEKEGSGIGLSLVKSLVEMQGGTICVKTELGKGCEFIIEIPSRLVHDDFSVERVIPSDKSIKNYIEKIVVEFSDIYD